MPHLASIKERYRLNPLSEKETYHLVIDLQDLPIEYQVGDCLGIHPSNDPIAVEKILAALQATGEERVVGRKDAEYSFRTFLTQHANLYRVPLKLQSLARAKDLVEFFNQKPEVSLTPQELTNLLAPLLPRLYSIASSMEEVGQEAHLIVLRTGLCSTFLCHKAPLNQPVIPIYHHKTRHFTLTPETHSKPIIMIGPGTGIAPFRGFLQERITQNHSKKNWLFFGERNQNADFYYQQELQQLVKKELLHLDLAFSRDQEEKEYVQHKMLAESSKLWQWLQEGAYLYVCGDAKVMAKDVDAALHQIIQSESQMSQSDTKTYIKNLKLEKRYLRDVY
ncbi:MAG: Sulfite reductase [NADPH] flavoprotein alpha-component [Chlamydiae bacterium]|nr:Sulfite reductase [NADPH] flavoprotein alpha-component [Chlamydiota bacterium]